MEEKNQQQGYQQQQQQGYPPPNASQPGFQQPYPPPEPVQQQPYPQPPPAYSQHYPQQPGVVYGTVPTVQMVAVNLGENSAELNCPACNSHIRTSVRAEAGPGAYIAALVIALFGCICGCCLIPLGIDSMKVFTHSCPNCRAVIGKYAGANAMASSRTYVTATTTAPRAGGY